MSVKYDSILGTLRIDDTADISSLKETIDTYGEQAATAHENLQTAISETKGTLEECITNARDDINNGIADLSTQHTAIIGEDTTTTLTTILQAVSTAVQDAAEMNKQAYSARFEQNTDTDNSYTLVLPIIAGVDETTQTATL